jgi:hypothetical protein
MDEQNIDIPVEIMQKIDSTVRLFEGDYSLTELGHMDIPYQRSLVEARLSNMERSRKLLETQGRIDAFSRKDYQAGLIMPKAPASNAP